MSIGSIRREGRDAAPAAPAPAGLRRRDFLLSSALAGLAASLPFGGTARAAGAADFGALSAFVTGRSALDAALAERAYGQLAALDPGFDAKLAALSAAIAETGAESVDAFLATGPAPELRATMTTITAAWYLGYTGTPDPSQESDNAKLVTYREALMWEPTADATPIPTYSQHRQNYWAEPPASIATD
ncbi:sugar dehydrogenase complex small subunit [Poseidonocella sp. HB161398]|uniref:sugar dehydrogenase complex small subunit n=1 Tax=Poseidonocella sp. HB161398 TaxID=2320855 RepID=UPI00110980BA|nr:sugar dehydrogenase complex small subunit [Poseidonocella sp. HB161398]